MAVIGIVRSETFEYVLDSDPCKKRVELEVARIEDGQKIAHDEVIEEGATISTLGVLDHVPDGVDLRPVDPGHPQRRGSPDRGHDAAQPDQHPQPSVPTLWITATPIRRISV